MAKIEMTINGVNYADDVDPRLLLVHYLRDTLSLTGTNVGCDTSQCGACTVLMNGMAVKSCTVLAVQAAGTQITTIEGLRTDGKYHPLQQAFWDCHGLQCGYCTSGMIMTAADLLSRNPKPTEEEIRHGIEGNLCRCTGYQNIVRAVQYAAAKMRGEPIEQANRAGLPVFTLDIASASHARSVSRLAGATPTVPCIGSRGKRATRSPRRLRCWYVPTVRGG